ncbi:putative quinol monooxygenase [Enterococcus sp. DIV0660C]|uniref:antibiotic biosynthesis monooxygenase family protein n=1 Tax=Enterococcus sp. DIV0660C TaxID=2230880 RepID=UPI001A907669|nr:putative quinol monooxygenase [Enterococcus sp. DIV0660C]MBO0431518.1 antibiotic biosynthesis monooxygenase [Enterococcus sp. DIV0660C]
MAITVNIYYSGTNGNAKRFAKEMILTGIVDDIRGEDGNIKYEYFFPMDDEETILLIDSWTDQKALDKHHDSPMMTHITKLREKYDLHMRVERYVTDINDISTKDSAFIRK